MCYYLATLFVKSMHVLIRITVGKYHSYKKLQIPEIDKVICCKQAVTMILLAYVMKDDATYSRIGSM